MPKEPDIFDKLRTIGMGPITAERLIPPIQIPADMTLANVMCTRLTAAIVAFQEELGPSQEVGAQLASFGQAVTLSITRIGYYNPHLLVIHGTDKHGNRCHLLQHISQANILLTTLPVPKDRSAHRIGFDTKDEQESAVE